MRFPGENYLKCHFGYIIAIFILWHKLRAQGGMRILWAPIKN